MKDYLHKVTRWIAEYCRKEDIRCVVVGDIRNIRKEKDMGHKTNQKFHGLPQEERLKNLLDKVRNPYCYLDNGLIVKLNFAPRGSSTLSECVGRCFQSAS